MLLQHARYRDWNHPRRACSCVCFSKRLSPLPPDARHSLMSRAVGARISAAPSDMASTDSPVCTRHAAVGAFCSAVPAHSGSRCRFGPDWRPSPQCIILKNSKTLSECLGNCSGQDGIHCKFLAGPLSWSGNRRERSYLFYLFSGASWTACDLVCCITEADAGWDLSPIAAEGLAKRLRRASHDMEWVDFTRSCAGT